MDKYMDVYSKYRVKNQKENTHMTEYYIPEFYQIFPALCDTKHCTQKCDLSLRKLGLCWFGVKI